jgi:hypothetical protein
MKPISEYNFREIVGKQVKLTIKNPSIIDPDYDVFVGLCYADIEAGISFHIYGGIKDEEFALLNSCIATLRYSDDINLELYKITDEGILDSDLNFLSIYHPYWIKKMRDDTDYDPFRSKQFPDDLLLPTQTIIDNKAVGEYLWIRPVKMGEDCVIGTTIENGNIIPIDTKVAIYKNLMDDKYPIIAVTNSWLQYLISKNDKGGT